VLAVVPSAEATTLDGLIEDCQTPRKSGLLIYGEESLPQRVRNTSPIRPPVESHFDSPEDIASDILDITSDPTVSKLDIAEYASMQYADAAAKRAAGKFTDTPDDNSD
jgi:hypothetical protein